MNNIVHDLACRLKGCIKESANEISYRLTKEQISFIHYLLEDIENLEVSLEEFEAIIDDAWNNNVEHF